MKSRLILLYFMMSSCVFISLTEGQNCPYPTLDQVNAVADSSMDNLAAGDPTTVVSNFSVSCLSVGTQRDRFRLATVVIVFTTTSDALQGVGCFPNTECISFLEMVCNDVDNVWERNQIFVTSTFTVDPNAPMNITRTDCGTCGIRRTVPDEANVIFDPNTHCFGETPLH